MNASFPNQLVEIRYARVKGSLLAQTGDIRGAEESFRRVLRVYMRSGSNVARPADRRSMITEATAALGELMELMIRNGRQAEAAQTWESYYPAFRSVDTTTPGTLRITYAGLPQGPVVWTSNNRVTRLPISAADLRARASDLRREVSNPRSSVERIRHLGSDLYRILFSGIASSFQNSRELLISLDPSFEGIPFDVLVDSSGQWLAERYQISYSLPSITAVSIRREAEVSHRLRLLAVASPSAARLFGLTLAPLPDAATEANDVAVFFPQNEVLARGGTARQSASNWRKRRSSTFQATRPFSPQTALLYCLEEKIRARYGRHGSLFLISAIAV